MRECGQGREDAGTTKRKQEKCIGQKMTEASYIYSWKSRKMKCVWTGIQQYEGQGKRL